MLKYILLFLFCLTIALHPLQGHSQTKAKQNSELSSAKKKIVRAKISHKHSHKKVVKKKQAKTVSSPAQKRKLVRNIINDHKEAIVKESAHNEISPALVIGIIATESSNNPKAISSEGAQGLMQTMPVANSALGIHCDSFDGKCSIKKGTAYLKHLRVKYGIKEMPKRLVAYNRGPEKLPVFLYKLKKNPETDSFVLEVNSYMLLAVDELRKIP